VPLDTDHVKMNGVCWYARTARRRRVHHDGPRTGGTGHRAVELSAAAQWANEFSDVVVKTDKSKTEGVPSGCV
jgi:hypothetical protein